MSTYKFDDAKARFDLEWTLADGHNQMPFGLENCYRRKPILGSNPAPPPNLDSNPKNLRPSMNRGFRGRALPDGKFDRGWGLLASRLRDWSCARCLMDLVWSAGVEPSPRCRGQAWNEGEFGSSNPPADGFNQALAHIALESNARYKLTRRSFDPL
jgi:hypothetical protein